MLSLYFFISYGCQFWYNLLSVMAVFHVNDGTLLSCMVDLVQLKHLLIITSGNVLFLA